MENQVPEEVEAERSRILLELDRKNTAGYVLAQMGRQVEILIEETLELDGKVYQTGHTREYIRAALPVENLPAVEKTSGLILKGELTEFLEPDILLFRL